MIQNSKKEIAILKTATAKQKELTNVAIIKERFANLDQQEMETCQAQCDKYLSLALRSYCDVLAHGDQVQPLYCSTLIGTNLPVQSSLSQALAVYRLISLWFSNSGSAQVTALVAARISTISSHKFVPLLYQMAARMGADKSQFSSALSELMLQCSRDHPHHALPIVLALAHAKEEETEKGAKVGASAADPRSLAAGKLLSKLEKEPEVGRLVSCYRNLCLALIDLAYLAPPAPKPGVKKLAENIQLSRRQPLLVGSWEEAAVLTDTLPVRPDRDYGAVCGIQQYIPNYSMVGGVNAPKKISCRGTDGVARLQLVKGKDDLRQDAVMEQVFGLMNSLLDRSQEARRRQLSVRTYKVVPLSQRSGVLEWCTNTQPLAGFLVGPDSCSGAHKKYFPGSWDSLTCRRK